MGENPIGQPKEELLALIDQTALARRNLGPYEFLRDDVQLLTDKILGQGNFSTVMLARLREKSGRRAQVVAKLPIEQALGGATERLSKDLVAEFTIMRQAGFHPFILQAIGRTIDANKIPLLLLEHVNGGIDVGKLRQNLFDADEDVDTSTKMRWLFEVSRGGDHLHSLGIIHRDLAVRNIIVSRTPNGQFGTAKIADFGLARKLDTNGSYHAEPQEPFPLRSTPPESLQQPIWNRACDIWMMGVTIWEMFHGNPYEKPYGFELVNRQFMLANLLGGVRLELGNDTPTSIIQVMHECLDMNPLSRPTMLQLAGTFQETHGDLSISIDIDQE